MVGKRAPKGQFKNSQVKEPDTDVSLESKHTEEARRIFAQRRTPNLSGRTTGQSEIKNESLIFYALFLQRSFMDGS